MPRLGGGLTAPAPNPGSKRLGVLVSGRGSNLRAVLEAIARKELVADVACVISNIAGVPALDIAKEYGVPATVIAHGKYARREDFDAALVQALEAAAVDVVLLAGFMRLLTPVFCRAFAGRMVNVHPSLLPAFSGAHAVRDALAYGAKVTGVTVHFVDEGVDTGPVILQEAVPILCEDTEATLHARLQKVEHRLVPQALELVCADALVIDERVVRLRQPLRGRDRVDGERHG